MQSIDKGDLGDNIIEGNIAGSVAAFEKQEKGARILLKEVTDPHRFGVATLGPGGKVVKIVNQVMAAVNLLAIGEAFALGVRCGADPATLYSVIKESSGASTMLDSRLPGFLLKGSFQPGFRLDLMKKDIDLAIDSARAQKVPLLLGATASQVFSAASGAGKGDFDFSAAAQFLASLAGVSLHKTEGAGLAART